MYHMLFYTKYLYLKRPEYCLVLIIQIKYKRIKTLHIDAGVAVNGVRVLQVACLHTT